MKPNAHNELMDDLLAGEELAVFRQASLQHGLDLMKKRRQRRRLARISAAALAPLLLTLCFWANHSAVHAPPLISASSHPATAPASKVHLINDDELLALFPNRPVALIGSAGHRKLVFLDSPNPTSPQ